MDIFCNSTSHWKTGVVCNALCATKSETTIFDVRRWPVVVSDTVTVFGKLEIRESFRARSPLRCFELGLAGSARSTSQHSCFFCLSTWRRRARYLRQTALQRCAGSLSFLSLLFKSSPSLSLALSLSLSLVCWEWWGQHSQI